MNDDVCVAFLGEFKNAYFLCNHFKVLNMQWWNLSAPVFAQRCVLLLWLPGTKMVTARLQSGKWTQDGSSDQRLPRRTSPCALRRGRPAPVNSCTHLGPEQTCQVRVIECLQLPFTCANLVRLMVALWSFKGKPCKWRTGLAKLNLHECDIRNCVLFSLGKDEAILMHLLLFKEGIFGV